MSVIAFSELDGALIDVGVNRNLGLIVTIPCFKEEEVVKSVQAILACDTPSCHVEILVLINTPEEAESSIRELNESSYSLLKELDSTDKFSIFPVHVHQIPIKKAGVGLARKLAMDEAARRLTNSQNPVKVISCFDADCLCEANYLTALYQHFLESRKEAVSIHYEHPAADLHGKPHERAVYLYELHLRYFIDMQRQINLPFAMHTVGSSMACTVNGYRRIGGMNKRKAGEDFYFLQKFIQDSQCDRLMNTTVYPSARESDRVPFGTGKAIGDILTNEDNYTTYHPDSFVDLEQLVASVVNLFESSDLSNIIAHYPKSLAEFLNTISFEQTINRHKSNTTSFDTFSKAFYQYFDAFQLMKYLHYARDKYYPNINILDAAAKSLKDNHEIDVPSSEFLHSYRELDKKAHY